MNQHFDAWLFHISLVWAGVSVGHRALSIQMPRVVFELQVLRMMLRCAWASAVRDICTASPALAIPAPPVALAEPVSW